MQKKQKLISMSLPIRNYMTNVTKPITLCHLFKHICTKNVDIKIFKQLNDCSHYFQFGKTQTQDHEIRVQNKPIAYCYYRYRFKMISSFLPTKTNDMQTLSCFYLMNMWCVDNSHAFTVYVISLSLSISLMNKDVSLCL